MAAGLRAASRVGGPRFFALRTRTVPSQGSRRPGLDFGPGAGTGWLRFTPAPPDLFLGPQFPLCTACGLSGAAGRVSGAMLGATLRGLCRTTLLGRQGALLAHRKAFQPQDKGWRCGGLPGWDCDLRGSGVLSQAHEPGPRPPASPPGPWRCLQSFLRLRPSGSSLPFPCISAPPPFLCVSVSPAPSVLHHSSLPLRLFVFCSVSCLVCVPDSNRGGFVSLCPWDLRRYLSLCVSGCLLSPRGGPEISLAVVGVGGAQAQPPSPTASVTGTSWKQPRSRPLPADGLYENTGS